MRPDSKPLEFDGVKRKASQLRAQHVPDGIIGYLARRAKAAPGQANYHKGGK